MHLTEGQRAVAAEALAQTLVATIVSKAPGIIPSAHADEEDVCSIALLALVSTAVAFAGTRCIDAPSAVALVRIIAESVATDIYGTAQ